MEHAKNDQYFAIYNMIKCKNYSIWMEIITNIFDQKKIDLDFCFVQCKQSLHKKGKNHENYMSVLEHFHTSEEKMIKIKNQIRNIQTKLGYLNIDDLDFWIIERIFSNQLYNQIKKMVPVIPIVSIFFKNKLWYHIYV